MKKIIEMKGINKYYSVGSVSLHALKGCQPGGGGGGVPGRFGTFRFR